MVVDWNIVDVRGSFRLDSIEAKQSPKLSSEDGNTKLDNRKKAGESDSSS